MVDFNNKDEYNCPVCIPSILLQAKKTAVCAFQSWTVTRTIKNDVTDISEGTQQPISGGREKGDTTLGFCGLTDGT